VKSGKSPLLILSQRVCGFLTIGCLASFCPSCATKKADVRANEFETRGDFEGAYNSILTKLGTSPNKRSLIEEKARVSELYAQDILRKVSLMPTNNLAGKIQLLKFAAQLESTNRQVISTTLRSLEDQRTEIQKEADALMASTNLVEIVAGIEKRFGYVETDPELRLKLTESAEVSARVGNLLTQHAGSNDARETRKLALRCENIWRDVNMKQVREKIDARLRYSGVMALVPRITADASVLLQLKTPV
jgi:hypothetical protein